MSERETVASAAALLKRLATAAHGDDWVAIFGQNTEGREADGSYYPRGVGAPNGCTPSDDGAPPEDLLIFDDPDVAEGDASYIATVSPGFGFDVAYWLSLESRKEAPHPMALRIAKRLLVRQARGDLEPPRG